MGYIRPTIATSTRLLAFLFLHYTEGFPQLVSVITTRDVASRNTDKWDIQHKGSKRLRDISEETVKLNVIVHNEKGLAELDAAQASGVLTYQDKEEESGRLLEGINGDLFCYRTVVETHASMDQLAEQYPDLVTVKTIGQSYLKQQNENEGYDIKVMVLGSTTTTDEAEKVDMMIVGGQHSRELPPPEAVMRWAEHLATSYGADADITWILDRTNIHIVPIVNPDGRQTVQDHLDWYYRTNGRPTNCDPSDWGVDLNRNYPMFYGDNVGSSSNECSSNYRGTGPLSEPESTATYQYARSLFAEGMKKGTPQEAEAKQNEACPTDATGFFIDVHSNGDFIYFPWGYQDEHSPNHWPLLTMAAKLASPGDYELWGPDQDGFLYVTSGDFTDATYGIDCVASVGYEIGSSQYATCEELESSIVPIMEASLLYAAKCVSAPYLLPMGPDVLYFEVDTTDPTNVSLVVAASDEFLIVDQARFKDEGKRSQTITEVRVFVDEHPYDNSGGGFLMDPQDGAYDDVDEVAIFSLDLSDLEGRHVLYFQATDTDGNAGPASAVYIDIEMRPDIEIATALPTNTPTKKPTTSPTNPPTHPPTQPPTRPPTPSPTKVEENRPDGNSNNNDPSVEDGSSQAQQLPPAQVSIDTNSTGNATSAAFGGNSTGNETSVAFGGNSTGNATSGAFGGEDGDLEAVEDASSVELSVSILRTGGDGGADKEASPKVEVSPEPGFIGDDSSIDWSETSTAFTIGFTSSMVAIWIVVGLLCC